MRGLIILIFCLLLSISFLQSVTFYEDNNLILFPSLTGTVCILQNETCVIDTEREIRFSIVNICGKETIEQNLEGDFSGCYSETSKDTRLQFIFFENHMYRATSGAAFYGESIPNIRELIISTAKEIHESGDLVRYQPIEGSYKYLRGLGQFLGIHRFLAKLYGIDSPPRFMNDPSALPEGFKIHEMSLLNDDGSESPNAMQLIVYQEDTNKIISPKESDGDKKETFVDELTFNLNGEIYTLISVEKEETNPLLHEW